MFYATNRWFLVPCSYRGLPWSRRGQSQRTSGQSWTLSRNLLSSEPDMKETSCWSSEVCTLNLHHPFLHTVTNIHQCVDIQHKFHLKLCLWRDDKQPSCLPHPSREELSCCCADCRMFRCAFAGSVPLSMAHDLEHRNKVNLPWYRHIFTSINICNCFAPPECCHFLYKLYKNINMCM